MSQVVLCECFARDGLQHEASFVPTEVKLELLEAFVAVGFPRIEATSYAHPGLIPQFRDASEVLDGLRRAPGVSLKATCPNLRAVERALEDRARGRGADEISLLVSASESHSRRNLRRERAEQWSNVRQMVVAARGSFRLIGTVSVAFGCPFEGRVDPEVVLEDVEKFAGVGVSHVTLADTVGTATPSAVRDLFIRVQSDFPEVIPIAHFHDSRGTGLVNYLAAWEVGVRYFDVAMGGAGGHPPGVSYGGGHTGNVCTEDWVHLLESMGVSTGLDLERLLEAGRAAELSLGRELESRVLRSGLSPLLSAAAGEARG